MPSDFLAVEFICLILALRRIRISSSIGCRRLDKLVRKQSNVTYVERRKMSLDNVRRQRDARCAPIWGSRPVLTYSRDSTTSPLGRQNWSELPRYDPSRPHQQHLDARRCRWRELNPRIQLGSLQVSAMLSRAVSDISQLSGRLRSLRNFSLSEWRLPAFFQAVCRWWGPDPTRRIRG